MPVLIGEQVKLFLSFASAIVVLWAFLRWVIRMQPKQQVFDVLRESKADYDELLFEALDRNPRNRDTFRNYTERVFADILVENERQAVAIREMQVAVSKLSDAYNRLEAERPKWDGHERRKYPRR